MKKVHSSIIHSLFPADVLKRAVTYYKKNRVTDLVYDKAHHLWTSSVHGRKTYFVEVNYDLLHKRELQQYCNCPAFATYDTCKHIAATVLSISDMIDEKVDQRNYDLTNHLLDALTGASRSSLTEADDLDVLTNKEPMTVEYICQLDYYGSLKLELKTGIDRHYVVRDIEELLENVFTNEMHYFTKNFSYDPDHHYFLEKDKQLLRKLQSILLNEEIYRAEHHLYTTRSQDKRYVTVTPLIAKELLLSLSDRPCSLLIHDVSYDTFTVNEDDLPFEFSIKQSDQNDFLLQIKHLQDVIYLDMYKMLFLDGVFYPLTEEENNIIEHLFHFNVKEEQLFVSKEQSNTFFSEALPLLEKLGKVDIDGSVINKITHAPLKATLQLHLEDESIIGKLTYMYDTYQIDPFSLEETTDIIVRDTKKERDIMTLIEQSHFHYNGKELYLKCADEAVLYRFLYTIIPVLEKRVELSLSDDIKLLMTDMDYTPEVNVRVDTATNLLEIGFSIDGVTEEEVHHILQAVIEKKPYYRMESGALISLEHDDFSSVKEFFNEFEMSHKDLHSHSVTLPAYRTTQIDEWVDMKKHYHPSFEKLLMELNSPNRETYDIPDELNAELRDYQKIGFQWFKSLSHYHLGGILADDMGLGKTIQTITFILSEESKKPHLIVVPASVVYNWRNEFRKFAPHMTVDVISGTKEERQAIFNKEKSADVWITSYGTIRQDIAYYDEMAFQTLILDEAQYIKNYATKTSQAVRQIKASKRFALSGTPIENSLDELWAIFQVVLPGLMPSRRKFRQLDSKKIMSLTRPFILRRIKEDVLSELPEKIESVHMSHLTEEQKTLYVGYLQKIQEEATQSIASSSFQASRMKILAGLTRLRQLCCHPSLFIENYEGKSGKLEELLETVTNLKETDHRMLIFSQFTSMHEIIKKRLDKLGIDYFYLHGETKPEERVKMSDRFNEGEKDVFLISLRAGGTGLNLTGADTVILFDLWWNPAVEDQAAGRAHRFGQKNVVQVIRFITEGTIEEKIYELQQKKRELIDEVIETGDSALSRLTEEDIRELLNL